jgi:flagellar biosynthesis chaperone FliJ
MAEVQTRLPTEPIAGITRSSGVDKDALITRLDALLEQYLHTLDEYEKLMQQLSKHLSSVCSRTSSSVLELKC